MWQYYIMIIVAVLGFSVQFVFTKLYQKQRGASFLSATLMTFINSAFFVPAYFALNSFKLEITWFSVLIACLYGLNGIICNVFGMKVLSFVSLSIYSMFLMLGGMLVPFVYGLIFLGEKITLFKALAVILTIFALAFTLKKDGKEKQKITPFAIFCFVMLFLTNGFCGVLVYIHQRASVEIVSSSGFLLLCSMARLILAGGIALGIKLVNDRKRDKSLLPTEVSATDKNLICKGWLISICAVAGYSVVHGLAQLLSTITASFIDAGVQSTITTGGCIFMSALFGLIFKEKITKNTVFTLILALAGVILMMF